MAWAPNPYSIARLLRGDRDIQSLFNAKGEVADKYLEEAFVARGKAKTVSEGLAVFRRVAEEVARARRTLSLQQVLQLEEAKRALEWYSEEEIRRVLPGLIPLSDAQFNVLLSSRDSPTELVVQGVSYRDPVQGDAGDCYLIAAMIALAWAKRPLLENNLAGAGFNAGAANSSFAWQFHDEVQGPAGPPVSVTGEIQMLGNAPRYAHSSAINECWPSLVEKAFVVKERTGVALNVEPTHDHYLALDSDTTPTIACQSLIGGEVAGEILNSRLGKEIFLPGRALHTASGVMEHPVMAWTRKPSGPTDTLWEKTGIWPKHAYAVLGVMRNPEHVVLRNPYGFDTASRPGHAIGPWQADGMPVSLTTGGVFAVSRDLFYSHFKHIGWVTNGAGVQ